MQPLLISGGGAWRRSQQAAIVVAALCLCACVSMLFLRSDVSPSALLSAPRAQALDLAPLPRSVEAGGFGYAGYGYGYPGYPGPYPGYQYYPGYNYDRYPEGLPSLLSSLSPLGFLVLFPLLVFVTSILSRPLLAFVFHPLNCFRLPLQTTTTTRRRTRQRTTRMWRVSSAFCLACCAMSRTDPGYGISRLLREGRARADC